MLVNDSISELRSEDCTAETWAVERGNRGPRPPWFL